MIKIKRIYGSREASDGKRILIDRLWPRGLSKQEAAVDEWLREIAPSDELRKWFGHDPKHWPEFRRRYLLELKEKGSLVSHLRKEGGKGTVTLLFSAKDEERNNAVVLRDAVSGKNKAK